MRRAIAHVGAFAKKKRDASNRHMLLNARMLRLKNRVAKSVPCVNFIDDAAAKPVSSHLRFSLATFAQRTLRHHGRARGSA